MQSGAKRSDRRELTAEALRHGEQNGKFRATPLGDRLAAQHHIFCARRKYPWGTLFPHSAENLLNNSQDIGSFITF